jgi:hypothetical protein
LIVMQIADLFDKVISNSKYEGNYAFNDLIEHMRVSQQSGLAIAEEGTKNIILIFVRGEPEGATLIEDSGVLFGNKALYLLKHDEIFKVFLTEHLFSESLAARCRVHDKIHLKKRLSNDLPIIGGATQSLGKLCIIVKREDSLQSGMRVTIRKGRQVLASDITAVDGKVCFKLQNGTYDCVVVDKTQNLHRFMLDFRERFGETVIDLGGA